MGSLQVRLFLTYLVIISVTLGLTALSLFLQIGKYRDSISYGNLEDLGRLIDSQEQLSLANATAQPDPGQHDPSQPTVPPPAFDLVTSLRAFFAQPGRVSPETSIALID